MYLPGSDARRELEWVDDWRSRSGFYPPAVGCLPGSKKPEAPSALAQALLRQGQYTAKWVRRSKPHTRFQRGSLLEEHSFEATESSSLPRCKALVVTIVTSSILGLLTKRFLEGIEAGVAMSLFVVRVSSLRCFGLAQLLQGGGGAENRARKVAAGLCPRPF